MTSCQDIFWEMESENDLASLKRCGKPENKKNKNTSKNKKNKTNAKASIVEKTVTENTKMDKLQDDVNETGVTLKDLNQEDKQKIAQLIHELAKVGEEKENIVHALNDERQKFFTQVRVMEDEKRTLMNKQQFLAEEVKQCQTLLQYYQNLITVQQTSLMVKEETKSQQDSFSSDATKNGRKKTILNSEYVTTTSADDAASQSDEIRVNDAYDPSSANSSVTEDDILRMSDRQYKMFLKRKKDKLIKEQESLRKLLLLKESSESEYDPPTKSPIRNFSNKSTSPVSAIKKRSIPLQTLSPIANKSPLSYVSPRRSTSNKSQISLHSNHRSPEGVIPLLSQDLSSTSLRELNHSVTKPLFMRESNMVTLPGDVVTSSFSEDTVNCDDSQILQDIFFVV